MGIYYSGKNKDFDYENINDDDYKCNFKKEELNKKLKDFINRKNIRDLNDGQKDKLNDSVYELIKKEENEGLVKFFDEIQDSFIQNIDNY